MPRRSDAPPVLVPPRGSRASRFVVRGEEFLVLSYGLGRMRLPSSLTDAEREVAGAFVRGSSMNDIARERGTSKNTVANQLRAIYAKLGATSRLDLARVLVVDREE
jgi:DNA-binding NarL/FixJ family response regulator